MTIIWSKKAATSFESYIEYISIDSPETAEKWAIRVFNKIEGLLKFPNIGKTIDEKNDVRFKEIIIEKNYIVVYKLVKERCVILAFKRTSINKKNNA